MPTNDLRVTFLGAAQTVTGSCYLLEYNNSKYLIDHGMFQGPDVFNWNYQDPSFDSSSLAGIFLTHAHLDHCGLLPKLFSLGFRGPIYATEATIEISKQILADSANVQTNNYKFRKTFPLYSKSDVLGLLSLFRATKYDIPLKINQDFETIYRKASHILGAASVELLFGDSRVCFSGDIGRRKPNIIEGFGDYSQDFKAIIMESLYGNRIHPSQEQAIEELLSIILDTIDRNGNVIIPVFALQRSQEILYILVKLLRSGQLPNSVQIYFDSPLGSNILKVYTKYSRHFNPEFSSINDPFGFTEPRVSFIDKKKLRKLKTLENAIIIASSGMAEGGRVIEHLKRSLGDQRNSITFVGFQAEETLGKYLTTKPKTIELDKKVFHVNAQIYLIEGFSAHGDKNDLIWWLDRLKIHANGKIFLTHAQPEQSLEFRNFIEEKYKGVEIFRPAMYESFSITL